MDSAERGNVEGYGKWLQDLQSATDRFSYWTERSPRLNALGPETSLLWFQTCVESEMKPEFLKRKFYASNNKY
jgi:hypothetical protein